MTTLTTEPDRIDLDDATGACIVRLREERDVAVAALRDRDATIARLTAAVSAFLVEDTALLRVDAGEPCTVTEAMALLARWTAARAALVALVGGDRG